ncbi:MAG: DUF309 domain-containing protein [Granulosicoccus sp.]
MSLVPVNMPEHAHVPGQNKRHADDAFDALRATAVVGHDVDQLARCDAFRAGLLYLDQGYYWEAHEVLEAVWMILPDKSIEKRFVQGIIQLANGRLKVRMGRLKAARRLVGLARGLIPSESAVTIMELDVQVVLNRIDTLEQEINLAI